MVQLVFAEKFGSGRTVVHRLYGSIEQNGHYMWAAGQELPPSPPEMKLPPKKTYVIRPGDSASVVSLIYGIPVNALRAANPNTDITKLRPGDSLNIPIMTKRFIRESHAKNIAVEPWTVDDPELMKQYIEWGVDGIMTDRPDLMVEILGK